MSIFRGKEIPRCNVLTLIERTWGKSVLNFPESRPDTKVDRIIFSNNDICFFKYCYLLIRQALKYNKKFLEELIAYFPWYDTDHNEIDASNNSSIVACLFVTRVTLLPSRCLATIGGFLPSRCQAMIGEFLPSCCVATMGGIHIQAHRLTGGIYEVRRWDGLRCQVS
jgi:hypothetical protein